MAILPLPIAAEPEPATIVRATNDRFVQALANGDPDGVAAVYAPDADLLAPDVPSIRGRSAIRDYWRAGLAAGIAGVTLETTSLRASGDAILESGTFALRIAPDGGASSVARGKYVVLHERASDGTWAWRLDCFNTDGPAA